MCVGMYVAVGDRSYKTRPGGKSSQENAERWSLRLRRILARTNSIEGIVFLSPTYIYMYG